MKHHFHTRIGAQRVQTLWESLWYAGENFTQWIDFPIKPRSPDEIHVVISLLKQMCAANPGVCDFFNGQAACMCTNICKIFQIFIKIDLSKTVLSKSILFYMEKFVMQYHTQSGFEHTLVTTKPQIRQNLNFWSIAGKLKTLYKSSFDKILPCVYFMQTFLCVWNNCSFQFILYNYIQNFCFDFILSSFRDAV